MQGISFTIQNPDSIPTANESVIYHDKLEQSKLCFSFTQDLGIPSVGPEDSFQIRFPDQLLKSLRADMLVGEDWVVKSIDQPSVANGHSFTILLSPSKVIAFDQLVIAFQNLPGKKSTNGELSLFITIGGNKPPITDNTKKLFVTAYPGSPKELTESILAPSILYNKTTSGIDDHPYLYQSTSDLRPPISNQLSLNLKYEQQSSLVEDWEIKAPPFFKISFDYGSSADDLTDALRQGQDGYEPLTSAYNIKASIEQNDEWVLEKASDTTVWTIHPTAGNKHLFSATHRNLNISFSHIISRLPTGDATLFIQWGNIPGYNDGWMARNIPKQRPTPKVVSFTVPGGSKSGSINYGEGVRLDWSVFGASQVQLRCDENPDLNRTFAVPATSVHPALVYCGGVRPGEPSEQERCKSLSTKKIVPIDPVNNFYLRALDNQGEPLGNEIGPVSIKLEQYPAPAFEGLLSIKEAIVPFSPPEKDVFWISPQKKNFTLGWKIADPNVIKRIDILGPAGTTLEHIADSSQNSAEIPFQKSGTYTILLRGKIESDVIRKAITINRLFEKELTLETEISAQNDSNDPWRIKIDRPDKVVHLYSSSTTALNMTISLKQDGTGILQLEPTSNHFKFEYSFEGTKYYNYVKGMRLLPIPPGIRLKPLPKYNFTWNINPESGDITIDLSAYTQAPDLWHLHLEGTNAKILSFDLHLHGYQNFLQFHSFKVQNAEATTLAKVEYDAKDVPDWIKLAVQLPLTFDPPNQTCRLNFDPSLDLKLSQVNKT